jgi:hypothetical protein
MSAQFPMVVGEDKRELPARFLEAQQFLGTQPTGVEVHIYHTSGTIVKVLTYDGTRQGWFYQFSAAEITTLGFGTWKCPLQTNFCGRAGALFANSRQGQHQSGGGKLICNGSLSPRMI